MNKKASVEMQFAWIFILIVGGIIFGFFFSIAQSQKTGFQKTIDNEVLQNLNSIVKGGTINPGSLTTVRGLPDTIIELSCMNDVEPFYQIGNVRISLPVEVLFAAGKTRVKPVVSPLYLWNLEWNYPYKITSATYMTSPYTKYYFLNDNGLVKSLFNDENKISFPENISAELITLQGEENITNYIKDNNYDRIIYVYSGSDKGITTLSNKLFYDKIVRVEIDGTENFGTITLHGTNINNPQGDKIQYAGRTQLFGAIITADAKIYNCTVQKQLERLEKMNKIMLEKINAIERTGSIDCLNLYRKAKLTINNIPKNLTLKNVNEAYYPSTGSTLESINNDLASKSCITIY